MDQRPKHKCLTLNRKHRGKSTWDLAMNSQIRVRKINEQKKKINKFYKIEFIQIQNFKDQRMLLRR